MRYLSVKACSEFGITTQIFFETYGKTSATRREPLPRTAVRLHAFGVTKNYANAVTDFLNLQSAARLPVMVALAVVPM